MSGREAGRKNGQGGEFLRCRISAPKGRRSPPDYLSSLSARVILPQGLRLYRRREHSEISASAFLGGLFVPNRPPKTLTNPKRGERRNDSFFGLYREGVRPLAPEDRSVGPSGIPRAQSFFRCGRDFSPCLMPALRFGRGLRGLQAPVFSCPQSFRRPPSRPKRIR